MRFLVNFAASARKRLRTVERKQKTLTNIKHVNVSFNQQLIIIFKK